MRELEAGALGARIEATVAGAPLVACFVRRADAPSERLLASLAALPGALRARVDLARIDIDADPARMDALRIFKVPELIVWAHGRELERSEGSLDDEQARQLIAYVLDELGRDPTPE